MTAFVGSRKLWNKSPAPDVGLSRWARDAELQGNLEGSPAPHRGLGSARGVGRGLRVGEHERARLLLPAVGPHRHDRADRRGSLGPAEARGAAAGPRARGGLGGVPARAGGGPRVAAVRTPSRRRCERLRALDGGGAAALVAQPADRRGPARVRPRGLPQDVPRGGRRVGGRRDGRGAGRSRERGLGSSERRAAADGACGGDARDHGRGRPHARVGRPARPGHGPRDAGRDAAAPPRLHDVGLRRRGASGPDPRGAATDLPSTARGP